MFVPLHQLPPVPGLHESTLVQEFETQVFLPAAELHESEVQMFVLHVSPPAMLPQAFAVQEL